MWRVVLARSDENSTLLSSEITAPVTGGGSVVSAGGGGAGTNHISSLTGGVPGGGPHHWGYPPPPQYQHHPSSYQGSPSVHQHPEMRHHHHHHHHHAEMRGASSVELRHDLQRVDLRIHQPEVRLAEMHRSEIPRPHQDIQQQQQHQEMRPDLSELRPSHELPELKIDGTELRTRENQQQQQQQQQQQSQNNSHQRSSVKRSMSDSDCDDVFSEESGKEPCNSPGGDSCQHASRKRRRGMIEKKRRDRINASLGELRRLVPAAARDPHSGKLEKAEILQLTVEHLRTLRNKGGEGYDSTKLAMDYHAVGWGECAAEVGRYLVTMEGLDERDPLRLRLLSHLQSFHREHPTSATGPTIGATGTLVTSSPASSYEPPASSLSGSMAPTPGSMPPIISGGGGGGGGPALGWGQYPGQYAQQQHGKPYRPWGAELAY